MQREADIHYEQYCRCYAREHCDGNIERARAEKPVQEYKEYCEKIFHGRVSTENGYEITKPNEA